MNLIHRATSSIALSFYPVMKVVVNIKEHVAKRQITTDNRTSILKRANLSASRTERPFSETSANHDITV
jgi:hypothetical protein